MSIRETEVLAPVADFVEDVVVELTVWQEGMGSLELPFSFESYALKTS